MVIRLTWPLLNGIDEPIWVAIQASANTVKAIMQPSCLRVNQTFFTDNLGNQLFFSGQYPLIL